MISKILLKECNLPVDLTSTTILVGPNNSGKTLLLSEIEGFFHRSFAQNKQSLPTKILKELKFKNDSIEVIKIIKSFEVHKNGQDEEEYIFIPQGPKALNGGRHIKVKDLDKFECSDEVIHGILGNSFLNLNAEVRAALINGQESADIGEKDKNIISAINYNQNKKDLIRSLLKEHLGLLFTIQKKTKISEIRLSHDKTLNPESCHELYFGVEAEEFHKKTKPLKNYSDGIKFFISIICHFFHKNHKLIFIDEPEAFLAPPLVKKLGAILSENAEKEKAKLFVATHNSDFLMGCLESKAKINVIRLTYSESNNKATAVLLPQEKLYELIKNPIIKHSGFMKSLFYKYVIICEADADRVFYEEMNQRLGDKGIKDCLFLNAPNGKDVIAAMVKPLRELGIQVAVIVDFDIIKTGSFNDLLASCGVVDGIKPAIEILAKKVKSYFDDEVPENKLVLDDNQRGQISQLGSHVSSFLENPTHSLKQTISLLFVPLQSFFKKKITKKISIKSLQGDQESAAQALLDQLGQQGIFLVPNGELEDWEINGSKISAEKNRWLAEVFEVMGNDPTANNYYQPNNDEIGKFFNKINVYLKN